MLLPSLRIDCFYGDNLVLETPPQKQDSVNVLTTNGMLRISHKPQQVTAVCVCRPDDKAKPLSCSVLSACPCVLCYLGYPAVSCIFLQRHDMQDSIHDNPQQYKMAIIMLLRRDLGDFVWLGSHVWYC